MSADLAATVLPYVSAAIGTYGAALLDKVRDKVVDVAVEGTAGLGHRILQAIIGRGRGAAIEDAVRDVVEAPADDDAVAGLRRQLRKVFEADDSLATDVSEMLRSAGVAVTAVGERSVAAHTISGVAVTGDNAQITR